MAIRRNVTAPKTVAPLPQIGTSKFKPIFVCAPHPYVVCDGHKVLDDRALDCFWLLCSGRFGAEAVPEYRISESFDIHRAVLAEWLSCLARRQNVFKRTKQGLVFSTADTKSPMANLAPAREYDPWVDRSADAYITSYYASFPWYIIDKYYRIDVDEVKHYTGEQRIRPDGRPFTPATYEQIRECFPSQPTGWKRGEWPRDRYGQLCEAASREDTRPRRGGIARRISAQAREAATKETTAREEKLRSELQIAAEARIDRTGVRGHPWLEDFCRRASPSTPDEWFISALAEEKHRSEATERWANVCSRLGYDPLAGPAGEDRSIVGQRKSTKSQSGAKLFRRSPIAQAGSVRHRG